MDKTVTHQRGRPDIECLRRELNSDKVLAWFESKGDKIVGFPRNGEACPLHGYIVAKCLPEDERVAHAFTVDSNLITCSPFHPSGVKESVTVWLMSPYWVSRFIHRIDTLGYTGGMTGQEAAEHLRYIRETAQ